MRLVIVESPSKAKTIQKYLGQDFRVMASGGHICDLPEKTLGIDLQNNYQPRYVLNKDKEALVARLKDAVKESNQVFLATDPDREGEAISWHLATNLGITNECRIEFNEISAKAVRKAIERPRAINMNLVDAQQARRVLDRLVGYKVSPILSQKIKNGSSGGRVQSSALKMIVDREREIRAFIPEEYWNINAYLYKMSDKKLILKAALVDRNKKKIKVTNKDEAMKITSLCEKASYTVENVKKSVSKSRPLAPFMTSTLQQDGSTKLGLTAPQIMQIAQQLYEGIEIEGEGQTALVTYIRTDSVRVSSDMQQETLSYIRSHYGEDYAPEKPNFYASKSQNTQDAHEAIRPISLDKTPESLKDKLSKNHYRLYKLIYDRFVASQMTDAIYDTLTVRIQADTIDGDNYGFKVSGRALIFKGYTAVYDNSTKTDEDEIQNNLPILEENEKMLLNKLTSEQKFTKAPPRFTDASLVKAMEENGIGRPSTYATVIGVLAKREYTIKEEKLIVPTPLGEKIVEFMEHYFSNIVDTSFTADMEGKLDKIEHGVKWQDTVADFYPDFEKDVLKAKGDVKMSNTHEVSDVICDKCGANMIVREGKYGKFLACPNFPKCKNIKSIVEPLGDCPNCEGKITKCFTKTGKIFYGCSNFPKCNYMSWDLMAPTKCPKCSSDMKVVTVGGKKSYVCVNKECKNNIDVTTDGEN